MARKKNKKQRSWIIQRIRIQESNKRQRRQRSRRKKGEKKINLHYFRKRCVYLVVLEEKLCCYLKRN